MERTWFLWKSFCVVLLLSTINLQAFGLQDIYLYNTGDDPYGSIDSDVSVKFLDASDTLHLFKREVDETKPTIPHTITDNRSNQQIPVTTTASPPTVENKLPPTEPNNATIQKPLLDKNLGENGAGIRKNYTTSTTNTTAAATNTTIATANITTTITTPTQTTKQQNNDHLIVPIDHNANQTDIDDDVAEISISKLSEEENGTLFNNTLKQHNITTIKTDGHSYYNSTFTIDTTIGKHHWIDLDNKSNSKINWVLSRSYRRAATVKLTFDFPFYGHLIRNVTIATGGFLYMGEYVHSWLAVTQYIAPLMANFDTRLSNDSIIKYADNGTAFTVQWDRVLLQDKPKEGEFSFQTTLLNTGDIIFVYKAVPLLIEKMIDTNHPVKVGLSDAYIIDQTIYSVRRKTIYEYHRVDFKQEDIKNWTVIYLKALPTCLDHKDCHSCLSDNVTAFECTWCPTLNQCSNGLDRHRQEWLVKGCDRRQLKNESQCSEVNNYNDHNDGHEYQYSSHDLDNSHLSNDTSHLNPTINITSHVPVVDGNIKHNDNASGDRAKPASTLQDQVQASRISQSSRDSNNEKMGASGIVAILFIVAIVSALGIWVLYAYRNPHTTSGQILIRYRPSQWRWKRGEARYTAATIHM